MASKLMSVIHVFPSVSLPAKLSFPYPNVVTRCLRFAVARDADQDSLVCVPYMLFVAVAQMCGGANFWLGSLRRRVVSSDDLFLASGYRVAPSNV